MSTAGPSTGSAWRSVAALARVEARALLRHPLFVAGAGFVLLGVTKFVRRATSATRITWNDDAWTVSAGFVVLAMLTMIAANFAALRDHREHIVEQQASLPLEAPQRLAGLLLATAAPATVAAVMLGAVSVYGATQVPLTPVDRIHLVAQVAIVLMFAVFGIALATWVRSPFVVPLFAWAFVFATPGEAPHAWQVLSPLADLSRAGLAAWHVVYTLGVTMVLVTGALARTARRRTVLLWAAAGITVVAVSAWVLLSQVCSSSGRCQF
jgi:hypothetical protein